MLKFELPLVSLENIRPNTGEGNTKLGSDITVWSLPAVLTCPGRTQLCERLCYATKHRFSTGRYLWSVMQNWITATLPFFVLWMVTRLTVLRAKTVRIHVSGDFFSPEYVRKWISVAKYVPGTTFYAYTRSWRVKDGGKMRKALEDFAALPNCYLWYSADRESGMPKRAAGQHVRIAYLAVSKDDIPPPDADLVFRDYRIRKGDVCKKLNGVTVCPEENGVGKHIGCSKCRICFTQPRRGWDHECGRADAGVGEVAGLDARAAACAVAAVH